MPSEERAQDSFLRFRHENYVTEANPVRVIHVFVDKLDLGELGFAGMRPEATGRPADHPSTMLKVYHDGYLNRMQSSRRLARETQRNVELMWLTGRLMPDFKTIANFRKDNGRALRGACRQFIVLRRQLNRFSEAVVAIDGSKFKAVNNRDKAGLTGRLQLIRSSDFCQIGAERTPHRPGPLWVECGGSDRPTESSRSHLGHVVQDLLPRRYPPSTASPLVCQD